MSSDYQSTLRVLEALKDSPWSPLNYIYGKIVFPSLKSFVCFQTEISGLTHKIKILFSFYLANQIALGHLGGLLLISNLRREGSETHA